MSKIQSKRHSKSKSKSNTKKSKKVGGGCGCSKMLGGKSKKSVSRKNKYKKVGGFGAASYQPFEQNAGNTSNVVIPFPANVSLDPNSSANMNSERLVKFAHNGGKKRKQRGGSNVLLGTSPYTNNITNSGTLEQATIGVNTLTGGLSNLNPAIYSQPVDAKFHEHNPPIV